MTNRDLDDGDELAALFGGNPADPVRDLQPKATPPAWFKPVTERFEEPCQKCGGSGSWRGRGVCFACNGQGKFTFKTSPEKRAQARASTAVRKERVEAEKKAVVDASAQAWIKEHKAETEWLVQAGERNLRQNGTFTFPQDVLAKLWQWGSLSENQLAAVRKLMARDVERAAERAARVAGAPVADTAGIDRLKAAFDKAAAYTAAKATGLTVRNPKISIGDMTISPAKATSANPGALYVKSGETYLGKIKDGRFLASRDCTEAQQEQVLKFVADPAEAAKVYGQETGVCCICNATLRSEWRLRGIGPICAEKFGW